MQCHELKIIHWLHIYGYQASVIHTTASNIISSHAILHYYSIQGRMQNLIWVGSFQEKVDLFDGAGVQSTPSMRSMLKLGGLGACPPRKFEK